MNHRLFYLLIALMASLAHLPANAAASKDVQEAVNESLGHGTGYTQIITSLTASPFNLSLEQATAAAIEAGGDSHAEAFAAAGIAAAANLPQAESVAAAARSLLGNDPAIDAALDQYVKLMDQPFIHHDDSEPTGGGVYVGSGGTIGGGTRPPVGGVRPPVSPSS